MLTLHYCESKVTPFLHVAHSTTANTKTLPPLLMSTLKLYYDLVKIKDTFLYHGVSIFSDSEKEGEVQQSKISVVNV